MVDSRLNLYPITKHGVMSVDLSESDRADGWHDPLEPVYLTRAEVIKWKEEINKKNQNEIKNQQIARDNQIKVKLMETEKKLGIKSIKTTEQKVKEDIEKHKAKTAKKTSKKVIKKTTKKVVKRKAK